MVQYLRLFWRLFVFAGLTFDVVFRIYWVTRFRGAKLPRTLNMRQQWARRLMKYTGVRIQVEGIPPQQACLLVSNHRSYIDPIAIIQDVHAFPVSKAELESWPLIGYGAKKSGILYLRRTDVNNRAHTLRMMLQTIRQGYPVLLFPEGTTSGLLDSTLPFRTGSFQMAAREGIPVVPVCLVFNDPRDFWVGSESFLSHAARSFQRKKIKLTIIYGPPMQHNDALVLAENARSWITNQLKQ